MINSSYDSLHVEVERLKNIFRKNGYTIKFIDRCILKFFNKLFEKRTPIPTVPKKEVTVVMPFLGTISYDIKKKLVASFGKLLPFCQIKFVFKTTRRMSSFFSYKDKLPKSLTSGVIYKYTCANCNVCYIGCTWRFWEKRLEEHTHISALTGKPLNGTQVFAPLQHVKKEQCNPAGPIVSRESFEIIGHEKDRYLLQVKESLLIKKDNPKINNNAASVALYLFS